MEEDEGNTKISQASCSHYSESSGSIDLKGWTNLVEEKQKPLAREIALPALAQQGSRLARREEDSMEKTHGDGEDNW